MELLEAARHYLDNGINVIVTDNNKRSLRPWKEFQKDLNRPERIEEELNHPKAAGIAIICGQVSGNLEVIDVDTKYALDPEFFQEFCNRIAACSTDLFNRLCIIKTRSGGFHIYYRCEVIEGNQKLAMREPTEQERKDNPQVKGICLIETRGEGGYVIAAPTRGYEPYQANPVPVITLEERDIIMCCAHSMGEVQQVAQVDVKNRPDGRTYARSPFDDYNQRGDVIGLLQHHGWTIVRTQGEKIFFKRPGDSDSKTSGDFHTGKNWFAVFTTNSPFEPMKAYLPYAVYAILECNSDFKLAARKLLDLGFGERRTNKPRDPEESYTPIETPMIEAFWEVTEKGKINISISRLASFLSEVGGFYLYFPAKSNIYRFVRVKDGFVEEATTEAVKKFIVEYINSLPDSFDGGITPIELLETIMKRYSYYFNAQYLEFLDRIDIDFLKDEPERAYFPFLNGVAVVEKGKDVVIKSYGEIGKCIWSRQVIDFNLTVDQTFDASLCEYARFIEGISGSQDKMAYAITLLGYLLHTWKSPARPFAAILAEETADENKGGGTGKGIFTKAIGKMIPVVHIDGRNFKIDKTFAFQRVGLDTKLVVIEDCPKTVEFEKFYPTITEGITIEKKNKDELFLNYADSPKICFTTNYSISQNAEHAKRRQRIFEFAPHYNSTFTPFDEFKHNLFDDWDRDEWNRFYNFMFMCVGTYLDAGILAVKKSDAMKRKHIKLAYTEEFLEYFDGILSQPFVGWRVFGNEYNIFLNSNGWDKKDYSNKRFKKALQETSELFNVSLETQRNWQTAGAHEFRLLTGKQVREGANPGLQEQLDPHVGNKLIPGDEQEGSSYDELD